MFGLTIHTPDTTVEARPLEATQKILDGFTELAGWAMYEVRNGVQVARHPGVALGARVVSRVMGVLHELRARLETEKLCSECKEARGSIKNTAGKQETTAHPHQTNVHLGPHPIDHHPYPGGIRVHPAPVINPGGNRHPRAAPRHH